MGVQTPGYQHPRYGFSEQRIANEVLTGSSLTGTTHSRPAGVRFAVAIGVFTLTSGSGEVQLLVEGSNDGSNWTTVASTTSSDNFTATATHVLNASSGNQVDLQRFDKVRFRAVIVSGSPTFTLQSILTAIAEDSEKTLSITTFTRSGTTPTSQDGTSYTRGAGTLLANAQIVASGIVHGGVTSWLVILEGSPDDGTTWVSLGFVTVSADGSQLLEVNGDSLFSLGSFYTVRFSVFDSDGPAGSSTAFTISCYLSLDSMDWTADEEASSGSGPFDPSNVFIQSTFGTPGTESGDTISLPLQLLDSTGAPLSDARTVELVLYDTSSAGDLDLASNATFSAASVGTIVAGTGTNRLLITTNSSGQATVSVLDSSAETVYCCAIQQSAPLSTPQILAKSDQATLAFS